MSLHRPRSPCPGLSIVPTLSRLPLPRNGLIRSLRALFTRPGFPRAPGTFHCSFSVHACLSRALCTWKGRSILGCPGCPRLWSVGVAWGKEPLGGVGVVPDPGIWGFLAWQSGPGTLEFGSRPEGQAVLCILVASGPVPGTSLGKPLSV